MNTFEVVQKVIAEQAGIEAGEIKIESTLEELKLDSLDMFQIMSDIEDELDITLETDDKVETVKEFVDMIEAAKS